jgi:hypothetical protein
MAAAPNSGGREGLVESSLAVVKRATNLACSILVEGGVCRRPMHSPNCAAAKDARMLSSKEECVKGMGQRLNDATVTDALITLSMEEVQEARYTTQIMQQRRMHESSHQRRSVY